MEKSYINFKEVWFRTQSKSEVYLHYDWRITVPFTFERSLHAIHESTRCGLEEDTFFISIPVNCLHTDSQTHQIEVWVLHHVKRLRSKDLIKILIDHWNGSQHFPDDYVDYAPIDPGWQTYARLLFLITWIDNLLKKVWFQTLIKVSFMSVSLISSNHKSWLWRLIRSSLEYLKEAKWNSVGISISENFLVQKGRSHHYLRNQFWKE